MSCLKIADHLLSKRSPLSPCSCQSVTQHSHHPTVSSKMKPKEKKRKGRKKVNPVVLLNQFTGPLTDDRMEALLWQQDQSKKRTIYSSQPETIESLELFHRPISAESKALSDVFDSRVSCSLPSSGLSSTMAAQVEEPNGVAGKNTFSKISVRFSSAPTPHSLIFLSPSLSKKQSGCWSSIVKVPSQR
jgi:hypothetical protein